MGGLVFPAGTRSVLFFGKQGVGTFCYGPGTSNQALVGTIAPGFVDPYCYDPVDDSKGTHAYPYIYQVWAYDANDLAAAKAGQSAGHPTLRGPTLNLPSGGFGSAVSLAAATTHHRKGSSWRRRSRAATATSQSSRLQDSVGSAARQALAGHKPVPVWSTYAHRGSVELCDCRYVVID